MFGPAETFKGSERIRYRGAMGFRNRQLCERETFVLGNGFHAFIEAIEAVPVRNDSEATVCEWPKK